MTPDLIAQVGLGVTLLGLVWKISGQLSRLDTKLAAAESDLARIREHLDHLRREYWVMRTDVADLRERQAKISGVRRDPTGSHDT